MEERQLAPKEKWYWPTIVDLPSAMAASNKGVWAAGIVAALTFVAATAAFVMSKQVLGLDLSSYVTVRTDCMGYLPSQSGRGRVRPSAFCP